ncbi:DUF6518 family protein [Cryptosporangium aurantiacum]|uniref:DUF6518 family protein n=1 Tax=Cryptosporangium aurantiacum TaxID=134849 RepID=UPI0015BA4294|nr:DUF6518 family protein [Cryptosporangium aurantiacum]
MISAVLPPVIGGILLGVLDFVWIKVVPFPLGGLGNSSAVWAVAAFGFAYRQRRGRRAGVLGSVVLLVVAVPSYYLAAVVVQGDDVSTLWDPLWTAVAVLAGVVFGGAGTAARTPGRWRLPALAVPSAVLFAEAAVLAARLGEPSYETGDILGQALVEFALGVLFVLLLRVKWRRRWAALAIAAPVAVAGFGLFRLTGFARSLVTTAASAAGTWKAHWAHCHPGYRCRHGHTSARRKPAGHPKNLYLRQDHILDRIAASLPKSRRNTSKMSPTHTPLRNYFEPPEPALSVVGTARQSSRRPIHS